MDWLEKDFLRGDIWTETLKIWNQPCGRKMIQIVGTIDVQNVGWKMFKEHQEALLNITP
jgi:hypothetical protein